MNRRLDSTKGRDYTLCMVKASRAGDRERSGVSFDRAERPVRGNARQRAQRADTRDRLLAAAVRVFARQGYADATIEDVLKEAGVSRATFYAQFEGKAGLVAAIADRFAPAWQPLYAELAAMRTPSSEALGEWCARHVGLYREHQQTCIILTQAAAIEPELYWRLAAYQEAIVDQLARSVPDLGHLLDDSDGRTRAALALSQIDHACYFLAVRHWTGDPAAGIAAMANSLERFLTDEAAHGRSVGKGRKPVQSR